MKYAYYNEIDPYAAQWLRNLIAGGHIAQGEVDERSIHEVQPQDIIEFLQCHFFAGIGGWSLALRIAGWPDDKPVWSGSAPCQPFSVAGKGEGASDERHLWPEFFRLIRECKPRVIFGEQVEAAINHGWLDLVQDDLEGEGYSFGAVGLPAASVGAPHIRQRLWFVADANENGLRESAIGEFHHDEHHVESCSNPISMADANDEGLQGWGGVQECGGQVHPGSGCVAGFWSDAIWLPCRDGKERPAKPSIFPLAHGLPGRVGQFRAYGNAIVPQVGAEFVKAYMECRP